MERVTTMSTLTTATPRVPIWYIQLLLRHRFCVHFHQTIQIKMS